MGKLVALLLFFMICVLGSIVLVVYKLCDPLNLTDLLLLALSLLILILILKRICCPVSELTVYI